jgi:hypothetical protein
LIEPSDDSLAAETVLRRLCGNTRSDDRRFALASAEPRRADRELQEVVMQVWIGFKQNEEYVHEWTGEVAQEENVGAAIGNAIADYRTKSGKAIWGMSITVDKARALPDSHATA